MEVEARAASDMEHTGLVYFSLDGSGSGYRLWHVDSNEKKHVAFPEDSGMLRTGARRKWNVVGADEGLVLLTDWEETLAVGNPSTNSWHTFSPGGKVFDSPGEFTGLRVRLNAAGEIVSYTAMSFRMEMTEGSMNWLRWGHKLPSWQLQEKLLEGSVVLSSYSSTTKAWKEDNARIFPTDAALLDSPRDKSGLRSSWIKWKERLSLYDLDLKATCTVEGQFEDAHLHEYVVCQGKLLGFCCESTLLKVKHVELSRRQSELVSRAPKTMVFRPSWGFSFSQVVGELVVLKLDDEEDEEEEEGVEGDDSQHKDAKLNGLIVYNATKQKWQQFPCEIDEISDGAFLFLRSDPLP